MILYRVNAILVQRLPTNLDQKCALPHFKLKSLRRVAVAAKNLIFKLGLLGTGTCPGSEKLSPQCDPTNKSQKFQTAKSEKGKIFPCTFDEKFFLGGS